ncbi:MAG: Gldg family protein [Gammaproteobacteria bacterium]|nr:Gldg family protein [Gammaproteobacteria bacterium]
MNGSNRKTYTAAGLGLLAVLFVSSIMLSNLALDNMRLDLTEQKLYTMSEGTLKVIDSIQQPINLYLFFSDRVSAENAPLRNYARRVRELLEEYMYYSDGRLILHVIDPAPYSEEEDRATEFNLQSLPMPGGDKLYFGLVGTNVVDDVEIIEFFQPDREAFLEYDISQLIYALTNPAKPVVGVLTGLQVFGGFDLASQRSTPQWAILDHIERLFEARQIDVEAGVIDPDIRILMLIHPKDLSEKMLYAVDQFLMRGGRLMLFADPYADKDPMFQDASNPPDSGGIQASDIDRLLDAWGLEINMDAIVADRALALPVQSPNVQRPVRHVSFIGLDEEGINKDNLISAQLSRVTFAFAGQIKKTDVFQGEFEPLLYTSEDSGEIPKPRYRHLPDPTALLEWFEPGDTPLTLAAWVRLRPGSMFPGGPPEDAVPPADGHLAEAREVVDAIVVADADMLSDTLWARVQNFFGQRIVQAWASNGDFIVNALESLAGSGDLIGLRGRSEFARPFHVVEQLRRQAEQRFHAKEEELQQRLQEAEESISRIQQLRQEGEQSLLTEQQRAEIEAFQQERLRVRRELRSVRHELDRDIEHLGFVLRLINIWLVPVLVTMAAVGLWLFQRRRRSRRVTS